MLTKRLSSFKLAFLLAIPSVTLSLLVNPVKAQITPDGSTSTTVTPNGDRNIINNGARAGRNLFHSFRDFSLPNGGEAFFNNALEVRNIINRVTGGRISDINGLISANGSANLFLINPAGIIFGPNARLNIGGSFLGSTADSLLFDDGTEFSATDTQTPILTINAPIGLNLRDNPQPITNRSTADNVGLEVNTGENITLVGGNVNLQGGFLTAPGGRIELGGLAAEGQIGIVGQQLDGEFTIASLNFPEGIERADVVLTNSAFVNVRSDGGGSIAINARNINLSGGEQGGSVLVAGISSGNSPEAQAGDITLNAAGTINIRQGSSLVNLVSVGTTGNSGNIIVEADSLNLTNDSFFRANTLGQGDAGDIEVNVAESLEVTGGSFLQSETFGQGDGGNVTINGENATISFEGVGSTGVSSGIFSSVRNLEGLVGNGRSGQITITADSLSVINQAQIRNSLDSGVIGEGNNINITANSLTLSNSGRILTTTSGRAGNNGRANAGNILVNVAESLAVTGGSFFQSDTFGQGDAGNVTINGEGATISFEGVGSDNVSSGIFSSVRNDRGSVGNGRSGQIRITADSLSVSNNARIRNGLDSGVVGQGNDINITTSSLSLNNASITANTFGTGNAGNVIIKADGAVELVGGDIFSTVGTDAVGDGGNINIHAREFSLTGENSFLSSSTFGTGNAGNVIIEANGAVELVGGNIFSNVEVRGVGEGGSIEISTSSLSLTEGAQVSVSTLGQGNAGSVTINASDLISLDGEDQDGIRSAILSNTGSNLGTTTGRGSAGDIEIITNRLSLTSGGGITASTFREGNAGTLTINATDSLSIDGQSQDGNSSGIFSAVVEGAKGNSGELQVSTGTLSLTNGGIITASTSGEGNAGTVTINAETITADGTNQNGTQDSGVFSVVNPRAIGDAGGIDITTANLSLTNGGKINANTLGQGNAGIVLIDATDTIFIDGRGAFQSGVFSNVEGLGRGNAGGIDINTNNLSLTNGGVISSSTFAQGNAGTVNINADEAISIDGADRNGFSSSILSAVREGANGNAGGIQINAGSLTLSNGGEISASTFGEGNFGGNITLNIDDNLILQDDSRISAQATDNANGGNIKIDAGFVVAFPANNEGNDIIANAEQGRGGNITINTEGIFGLEERKADSGNGTNDIDASSEFGLSGQVTITNLDTNVIQGASELPENVVEPETRVAQACSATNTGSYSSLTVKGRGSLPKQPTDPLTSDSIYIEGESVEAEEQPVGAQGLRPGSREQGVVATFPGTSLREQEEEEEEEEEKFVIVTERTEDINPDDIIPARGMIVKPNGDIILTGYPTPNVTPRVPTNSANCRS
jgi:filamentous hemagglutinin family protein